MDVIDLAMLLSKTLRSGQRTVSCKQLSRSRLGLEGLKNLRRGRGSAVSVAAGNQIALTVEIHSNSRSVTVATR